MSKSSMFVLIVCLLVFASSAVWAQDDPTVPPTADLEEAGIVATDPIYPFVSLSFSPSTRHSTVAALPNGNFIIIVDVWIDAADDEDQSNMSAVILDPQGNIVAGPSPVVHDADGPIGYEVEGVNIGTGDPWLSLSRDGSEVAIAMHIYGHEGLNFPHPLYPNDPGTVYLQRLSTTDLSPLGPAVCVFPGAVTHPTPDQTNFGYHPTGYMPNGNIIILARSRDAWDLYLRDEDPLGRNETQRIGIMTIVNGDATQVVAPPQIIGREYGHDLLQNPNQWNAEPSRGVVPYADGCVICLAIMQGWATVDQDGNVGEWHYFYTDDDGDGTDDRLFTGDGNQGALLTNGQYLTGKTEGGGGANPAAYVVYDVRTGERLQTVHTTVWEDSDNQRSFGAMNSGGQVFMIWQEHGLFGLKTAVGRFADADGTLYGAAPFILMESGTEAGGMHEHERGQCAFSNTHAIYVNRDSARPGFDPAVGGPSEVVVRIFENPLTPPTSVETWELY